QFFFGLGKTLRYLFLILIPPEVSRKVRPVRMHMFDPLDLVHSQFAGRFRWKNVEDRKFAVLRPVQDPNDVIDDFQTVRHTVERDKEAFHESTPTQILTI